ncbi:MAG: hypothetical protein J5892_05585 [Bacilli bacterium]|nr:hypothetical protein [Bacilli bacterium]
MKEKNIKINHKALVKLATFAAVGTVSFGSLAGCVQNNNVQQNTQKSSALENTLLNDTYVITFENGTKDIAKSDVLYSGLVPLDKYVYTSVISGNEYTKSGVEAGSYQEMPIATVEPISAYLTADDLVKAMNDTLSNDDVIAIINRINLQGNDGEESTLTLTNN